jgi:hypothetical protein
MQELFVDGLSTSIAAVGCAVAFFGGIALIQWVVSKGEAQKRQLEHDLRLKALELGQPLPDADIARANAERSRAAAAGAIGILVPLFMAGAATGSTALVFQYSTDDSSLRIPLFAIVWGMCGVVSLVAVSLTLTALLRRGTSISKAGISGTDNRGSLDKESAAFTERPTTL